MMGGTAYDDSLLRCASGELLIHDGRCWVDGRWVRMKLVIVETGNRIAIVREENDNNMLLF
jgi:hypothetical protein